MLQRICSLLALCLVLPALAMPASLQVNAAPADIPYMVDSTLDEPDANVIDGQCSSTLSGKCTLRAAVMQANQVNVNVTIMVPAGTYTLTIGPLGSDGPETGDLNLTMPASGNPIISIVGAGANSTFIDGNGTDRVFYIAAGRTASISGVTIRNGQVSSGGGIYNNGTATLNNSTLSANSATQQGGGIYNNGTATLNNSTLSGNSAKQQGGGIYNRSSLYLTNSTLSQNTSDTDGGGIYNAIGIASVFNTSILFNGASADPNRAGSAGGVFNNDATATFDLRNTLVAGNINASTRDYDDCTGTLNSYGRNLFWLVYGCTVNIGSGVWGLLNSLYLIGPLQNNGGPTFTHALLAGSSAIDWGDPDQGCVRISGALLTTDQRGAARVVGPACDIGAFEYRPPLYLPLAVR